MTIVEDGRLILNKSNQCILLFILVEMIQTVRIAAMKQRKKLFKKLLPYLISFVVRFHTNHIAFVQLLETAHTTCTSAHIQQPSKVCQQFLKSQLKENKRLHYWILTGVKNSKISLYQDGVHFNDVGNYIYYRNLRSAIIQSLHTQSRRKKEGALILCLHTCSIFSFSVIC